MYKHSFLGSIKGMFIELDFRKSKWLLFGTYHPPRQMHDLYFDSVGRALNIQNDKYDKMLIAGDFNAEDDENINNFQLLQITP